MDMHSRVSPSVTVAGAALLCCALAQRLSSRDVELSSEALCWILLPFLVRLVGRGRPLADELRYKSARKLPGFASTTSNVALLFALAVTAAAWYRAEQHVVVLFPALTPLLIVHGPRSSTDATDSRIFDQLAVPINCFVAVFASLALVRSNGTGLVSLLCCLGVVGVLFVSYLALARLQTASALSARDEGGEVEEYTLSESFDIEDVALPWAMRIVPIVVVALLMRTWVLHEPNGSLVHTAVVGVSKAIAWILVFKTTAYSSWCVATTIGTFAIAATRDPFAQVSDMAASCHAVSAALSLGQTICMLPKSAKKRWALWVLVVVPVWPFMRNVYDIRTSTASLPQGNHPIEQLARGAAADFEAMLERQSSNYTAAVAEYRRRYKMAPPPGFEAWYNYAASHSSVIMDEFDTIHEAVAPFLKLSGRRVREAMQDALGADDLNLWSCELIGATGDTKCHNERRTSDRHIGESLSGLLGGVRGAIPDVLFLVNHLDEPRVMLPSPFMPNDNQQIRATRVARESIWSELTKNCPPRHRTGPAASGKGAVDTHDMPFVTNTREDKDLCQHHEYRRLHGMVMAPTSFVLLDGAVPVLSTGALSTMGDVLFPSPAYNETEFIYDEARDVPWSAKHNNLYWAGSTTGGYASAGEGWMSFHRQRFVALAQSLTGVSATHWYLRESASGIIRRVASSFLNSRLWDVAFTRIFQCDSAACGAQRTYFRARPWADKDAALRSRLAFDLDGNGISGRFGKLLASRSAPLKQTLLREWHDERLVAWVHYVPVSLGMEELPELVNWLTGSATGRRRAEAVAEAGRAWAARALRGEDRAVYVYRLMLELARLVSRPWASSGRSSERSQNHPGNEPPWWSLFLTSDFGGEDPDPATHLDSTTPALWPLAEAPPSGLYPEQQHLDLEASPFQLSAHDFFESAPNSNSASLQSSPEEQLIQDILGLSPSDGPLAVDESDMAAVGLFGPVHSHGMEPTGDGQSHHHDMFASDSHHQAFLGTSSLQHHGISHRRPRLLQDPIPPNNRATASSANHQPSFAQAANTAAVPVESASTSATPASSVHAPFRTYSHQQPHNGPPASPSSTGSNKRKQSDSPPDEEDEQTVIKRQRNTMAARKYRQKRLDRIADLERALGEVTGERDDLKLQLARREAEVDALREMLARK
ncbi:capsule-associated protein CAP1 [Purpureocillium lavendulum]|uniref:Capsule-associated protein CAP1 n=1 Tax=Purpureocillium lavendulum TaxID=1247861 RepID=A0AB34FXF8_9HYPO|nr:capsule-associated protein CAP1 [Purpureocillium lavendulum]